MQYKGESHTKFRKSQNSIQYKCTYTFIVYLINTGDVKVIFLNTSTNKLRKNTSVMLKAIYFALIGCFSLTHIYIHTHTLLLVTKTRQKSAYRAWNKWITPVGKGKGTKLPFTCQLVTTVIFGVNTKCMLTYRDSKSQHTISIQK